MLIQRSDDPENDKEDVLVIEVIVELDMKSLDILERRHYLLQILIL